jgi:hypothetical protein
MAWLFQLELIRFFEFHLAVVFLLGTALRIRQYLAVTALIRSAPRRWPKLMANISRNLGVLVTPQTLLPAVLAGGLLVLHVLACRTIWPHAEVRVESLAVVWPVMPFVLVFGVAMTVFDLFTLTQVGTLDRQQSEKYLDDAEGWLRSWAAPLVSVITFGFINPRKIVDVEVKKALEELNKILHATLWTTSIQAGLRLAYGVSLWIAFAWLPEKVSGTF